MKHARTLLVVLGSLVVGSIGACGGRDDVTAPPVNSTDNDGGTDAGGSSNATPDVPGGLPDRASDPVVLTGGQLPGMVGVIPGDVVAFVRQGGTWRAVPVQVDERILGDFCEVYAKAKLGDKAPCKTTQKIETIFYADPATYTGADSDPKLDTDDEVVFMARDSGDAWRGNDAPPGVLPGSGVEIQIEDGDRRGFVYLFVRSDPSLAPAAGSDLVQYTLAFAGVSPNFDYKSDYPFVGDGSCGYLPSDPPLPCDPPILEDSRVVTKAYQRHFVARWVTDELRITRGDSDGADILDVAQARFAPNICGRTVSTFSMAEGAFIANVDGPVRAIRSYLGANSGPLTQRTHLFYDTMEVTQTVLRVHEIGGIMDLQDYEPAATGMTYFNAQNVAGMPIDGKPDVFSAALPEWELVTGPHGAVMHTVAIRSSSALTAAGYWLDDRSADMNGNDQCEHSQKLTVPDTSAWGQSGVWISATIPDTDPRNGSKEHVYLERVSRYEAPSFGVAQAQERASRGAMVVSARPLTSGDRCGDGTCSPSEADTCPFDCAPYRAVCGDRVCDVWENSVSCPQDCSSGGAPAGGCGDAICGADEHELRCAPDCWSTGFVRFAGCLASKCAMEDGACSDEIPCVDYVVCVAECVAGGQAVDGCKSSCSATVATTAEQHAYGEALLACAQRQRCVP